MHSAHQELFKKLDKNGGIVVIQTDYANLTPLNSRQKHTMYPVYFYPLANIKHLSAVQFIKLIKEEFPNLITIVVGFDFKFGQHAAYNNDTLVELFDGNVEIIDEYKIENIAVHSRDIRSYLRDGNIEFANKLLGYNYNFMGLSLVGQGLGSKHFVPTININVTEYLIPQEGIYITRTKLNERTYESVTFIGHRMTTDGNFAVETNILNEDFNEEIPKNIQVEFVKRIRDNKKYEKFEDLKKEIENDIGIALSWFKEEK
jgi:riboflavin kinase/FMN adenylyltransferase